MGLGFVSGSVWLHHRFHVSWCSMLLMGCNLRGPVSATPHASLLAQPALDLHLVIGCLSLT